MFNLDHGCSCQFNLDEYPSKRGPGSALHAASQLRCQTNVCRFLDSAAALAECRGMLILALGFVVVLFGQDLLAVVNRPTR